jgi:hypothetical protein
MDTPPRGTASPHIGRLRRLTPGVRALLQTLLPLRQQGAFRQRIRGVARLGERDERTALFPALAKRIQPAGCNRQLSRWWAERTRRADRSPIAKRTRQPPPVVQVNRGRHTGTMWAKRTREAAASQMRRTNPEAAARTKPVPSPSRLNPRTRFRLKILLYFSCCLQGGLFLRSLRLCPFSAFGKDQSVAKAAGRKESRGEELTRRPGCFGRPNPRVTQATI